MARPSRWFGQLTVAVNWVRTQLKRTNQTDPLCITATTAVSPINLRSDQSPRCSMYSRSIRIHSANLISLPPRACQVQVSPGKTDRRWRCQGRQPMDSSTGSGRGPTSDICPVRTLNSCGSSSMQDFRRYLPTVVTHGAELENVEDVCVFAFSFLTEKYWTFRSRFDGHGSDDENWR